MRLLPLQGALHFGMASGAMLAAFAICEGLHDLMRTGSIVIRGPHAVFLPHGVVVVFAWMYGWAAIPLLYPAALFSAYVIFGSTMLDPLIAALLAVKLVAVPLAFDLFRWAGRDARGTGAAANWKMLVMVGLVGSAIGNVPRVAVGPCCGEMAFGERLIVYADTLAGDMAGLLFVLVAMMLFFRALRHG